MTIIALVGDCTTTTAVAMAAAWPSDHDVVIFEADRSGGSLAGWLDTPTTPSLSSLVATSPGRQPQSSGEPGDGIGWPAVERVIQQSPAGIRFIAAPVRSREAAGAIDEADRLVVPLLASDRSTTVLADVGRRLPADGIPAVVAAAGSIVVIHRQDPASAGAASIRLDRLVELVAQVATVGAPIIVCIVGDRPFDVDEIATHVSMNSLSTNSFSTNSGMILDVCLIAVDPLSAMVFAGRTGVSRKRLARLPLARSVTRLVDQLAPTTERDGHDRGHGDVAPTWSVL